MRNLIIIIILLISTIGFSQVDGTNKIKRYNLDGTLDNGDILDVPVSTDHIFYWSDKNRFYVNHANNDIRTYRFSTKENLGDREPNTAKGQCKTETVCELIDYTNILEFELIPNDQNAAIANYSALKTAFESGNRLIVDDTFFIQKPGNVEINITQNLFIKGVGKFIITNHVYTQIANVNTINTLDVECNFEGMNANDTHVIFRQIEYTKVNHIRFDCSLLKNSVTLWRSNHGSAHPDMNYGIGDAKIKVNILNQTLWVVEASNTPFNNIDIDVTGLNFSNVPFWFGITNDHGKSIELKTAMNNVNIKYDLDNESNYSNVKMGFYYTVLLSEGNSVYSHNNTVRNMKHDGTVECVDIFPSANTVDRGNNFAIDCELTSLLKIKKAVSFKSFQDTFIYSGSYTAPMKFYDNGHNDSNIDIQQANVNVKNLGFQRVGFNYENILIKDCILSADNVSGYLVYPKRETAIVKAHNNSVNYVTSNPAIIDGFLTKPYEPYPTYLDNRGFNDIEIIP